jgi:hypothetical protein
MQQKMFEPHQILRPASMKNTANASAGAGRRYAEQNSQHPNLPKTKK